MWPQKVEHTLLSNLLLYKGPFQEAKQVYFNWGVRLHQGALLHVIVLTMLKNLLRQVNKGTRQGAASYFPQLNVVKVILNDS